MHVTCATDITDSLYKLLWTHKEVKNIQKYFANNSSADSELSKAKIYKRIISVIGHYWKLIFQLLKMSLYH